MFPDFEKDLENNRFERLFADEVIGGGCILSKGYEPRFDVDWNGIWYEIKRDYYFISTGNLMVEDYFNWEEKKKGWIHHTQSDYLVVFYTDVDFFIVDMNLLKFLFHHKYGDWEEKFLLQKDGFHTRFFVSELTSLHVPEFGKIMNHVNNCLYSPMGE